MKEGGKHTRIDLSDLWQRQPHLIAIDGRPIQLQGVAFKVDSLQLLLILQLTLDLLKAGKLVIRSPELFEVLEHGEVLQVGNLVIGEVQDTQCSV